MTTTHFSLDEVISEDQKRPDSLLTMAPIGQARDPDCSYGEDITTSL